MLNTAMVDLHCHLLPNVDDGPRTLSESLDLAAAVAANNIHIAVVTPHIYPPRWNNCRSNLTQKLQVFQRHIQERQLSLDLRLGAEVRLSADILPLLEQDEIPFLGKIGGHRIMLLEMPDAIIPLGSDKLIKFLLSQNIRPLIAHPERNLSVIAKAERLVPFLEMGCWLQVTAGAVLGQFGSAARKTVRQLMEWDWVSVMATDCHNLQYRFPNLREARAIVAKEFGEEYANRLVQQQPAQIVGIV